MALPNKWKETKKKIERTNAANSSGTKQDTSAASSNKTTNNTTTVKTNTTPASTYSPYTNLGSTYNANTNYQAIINDAVANNDYLTAAKAEQLRNQKIDATGVNYGKTNMYSGYLDPDYGTVGQQQMANNASWEDVLDTYNSRYNKAVSTEGLDKYANDEIQQEMWNYIVSEMQKSNQPEEFTYDEKKPTQPKSDYRIDSILDEILNREAFSYDAMNDPLYQQYAEMYRREGDRAMRDTLAEVAAGAGGMNSYAITAAQQANNYYNSQLNDVIPELYRAAYDKYLKDIDLKVQDLGILQDMDATQYNRYRDTMQDWKDDRNFAYGQYQDDVQQGNWQTTFDYNSILDNRNWNNDSYWANKEWDYNDMWANKEWDAQQEDKEYERSQEAKEEAKAKLEYLIENGVTSIDPELISQAGWTQEEVKLLITAIQAQQAAKGKPSGVGSDPTPGEPLKPVKVQEEETTRDDMPWQTGDEKWDASGNYKDIDEDCKGLLMTKGKDAVLAYLKTTLEKGAIDIYSYMTLVNKYRG